MVKTWVWSLERADSSEWVPVSPVLLSMRLHCGRRGERRAKEENYSYVQEPYFTLYMYYWSEW